MKKLFTLICALAGFAGASNAATIDDVQVCKHSYVLCFDDWDGAGTAKPGKGALFGNGYFLDVTGGSVATNKGSIDLSTPDGTIVTEEISQKYGEYGSHLNSFRLKNAQDVIAMKVTAKSKLIFFFNPGSDKSVGSAARYPKIATDAKLENALNEGPSADHPTTNGGYRYEWTAADDGTIYIGTYNGDTFFSYLIVEANEAPGTPTVKVGDQTFENGLWFREVTCKANDATEEGSTELIPTIVTYTTDGSAPTAASSIYKEPIKCYKDMTVKFQAFLDFGDGVPSDDFICDGADNEAGVNFIFDAPAINTDGATFTITSPYATQNGTNYYKLNGGDEVQGDGTTLTESATVTAYTKITNGNYTTFTTNSASAEVYVLDPIKTEQTITISGTGVIDEENSTADATAYKASDDATINYDKKFFFVRNTSLKALMGDDAQYRVPADQELYLMLNGDVITFQVAEGDSVNVTVNCSKNACKNLAAEDAAADKQVNGCTPDRSCYINVDGTNYCAKDADGKEQCDLKLYPETANVVKFGLKEGIHTFKKYSGTGNILVSSIEITPVKKDDPDTTGITDVKAATKAENAVMYNIAGQKVSDGFKGLVIKNGKKVVLK